MAERRPGRVVIVSGPSGVGKTSVLRRLLEAAPVPLVESVSATTRPPREGERDGVDYHFMDQSHFDELRRRGEFLECCEVFGRGYWYGTLKREVLPRLEQGKWVVLEIDVDGAKAVLEKFPGAVTIFIRPSSWAELEARLRGRGTETEQVIERRLEVARRELALGSEYRYQVVNDSLERAVGEIIDILKREKTRV